MAWAIGSHIQFYLEIKMRRKIKVPIFAILKALVPIIREISSDIQKAKDEDSEGGTTITKQEIREILLESVFDLVEVIAEAIYEDNVS